MAIETILATELNPSGLDNLLIDHLNSYDKELGVDDGVLYYGFPVFKNYEEQIIKTNFLLVSKKVGVLLLSTSTEHQIEEKIEAIQEKEKSILLLENKVTQKEEIISEKNQTISEKIKELRTDLKMNQKNFSAAIGIRQSTLSSYENGVVTPSNDVLLTIAQKFHVSLDWLFGLSENKVQISTLSDILWVLLQMNESNELRYELDINNKLPGDIETETQKWYAGLRFYGNDPEHSLNADMCNFLADLQENRESLESYFTGKDMFDMWKKQTLEYYTSKPVTHKEIEELDFETRIRKRDELLTQKFSNNEQK